MTSPTDSERPSGRWFRDIYRDAVWESEHLSADQKAVLETYARHARNAAGDKGPDADLAWLTYPRLMAKSGIRRRAKVPAIVDSLVAAGWLALVHEAPRRSTIYRLVVPVVSSSVGTNDDAGSSDVGTTDETAGSSNVGTTVVPSADHGSSTSAAGSSNGGTQPLGPLQEQPLTTASLSGANAPPPTRRANQDRERDGKRPKPKFRSLPHRYLAEIGWIGTDADWLIARITADNLVDGNGWWVAVKRNGTLLDVVQKVLDTWNAAHGTDHTADMYLDQPEQEPAA
ncbi:hypothetical protein BDK92_7160 [Micromonospora pisi]|uniref:Uncharacterized protein n=1 Tax=Micromonospora pisi TaxID=589240 RepID=A0A495JWF1_9ACTN|nr:hypothetical protein [Micromonospora pisi]RKR92682.1 hypothetical protein BDK92_7160 [Micromonospora pisi]